MGTTVSSPSSIVRNIKSIKAAVRDPLNAAYSVAAAVAKFRAMYTPSGTNNEVAPAAPNASHERN